MAVISTVRRGLVNLYRREILRDKPLLEAKRWFRDRGDSTLRLNYPLTPESTVVDLGGYVGDFAAQVHERYGCVVHVFEPVPKYFEECARRFAGQPKVHVHPVGLGLSEGSFPISDEADASSFFSQHGTGRSMAEVRAAASEFDALGVPQVDLLKLNIEGGEYEVLPALIAADWIRRIKHIQVQFHTVGSDYETARKAIRSSLAKTHTEDWCYEFVWESWSRSTP